MSLGRKFSVVASTLALLGGTMAHAAINDMHMFSGGGSGLGGSGPCLTNTEIQQLATALRDIDRSLGTWRKTTAPRPTNRQATVAGIEADAEVCAAVAMDIDTLAGSLMLYRGLLPDDAIVRPELSHRIVYNDRTARSLRRPEAAFLTQWQELRENKDQIKKCNPGADIQVLSSDPISAALELLRSIPTGASITLPYEPYIAEAGTPLLTLNFNYWPFDHAYGRSLAAMDDLRSARVDVGLAYSVTDWLRLGVRAPFTLIADTPEGTTPERDTGIGDLTLSVQTWWTEPLTRDASLPLDSIWSVLHLGSGVRLSVPVGSEAGGLSHGNTVAHIDFLKAALQLRPRVLPRFHLLAGRIVEIESDDDDGDDSPSRYPGGWEFAAGAIWNLDPWRDSKGSDWNLAWWGDVAGMFHDRAMGPPGSESKRALELRGGLGYLRQSGGLGDTDRVTRMQLSLELARRLDDGLRSGVSWQVALSLSR